MAMSPEERAARALVPSTRPNWTPGNNAMPTASGVRDVVPSSRPNWVPGASGPEILDPKGGAPGPTRAQPGLRETPFREAGPRAPIPEPPRPVGPAPAAAPPMPKPSSVPPPPQFAPGSSPQAQAWQAERMANQGPQPRAGGNGLRAQAGRVLANPTLQRIASVAGKAFSGAAGAGAVADSMEDDSTARYAQRFGVSEPTGDGSAGDIAKFAGLRALGFASDLGNRLTGGLAGRFYEDNQERPQPPVRAAEVGLRADPAVTAAMPRAIQTATGALPPAAQPEPRDNVVTVKNGNDFSGSNVKEGFSYEGQLRRMPGGPIGSVPAAGITAALNGGGGGFSSTLPRSNDAIFGDMEQRGIEQRYLEGLVAEQRAASARPAPPMSLNDALLRLPTRSISEDLRAKTDGTYDGLQLADAKARKELASTFMGTDAQRYGSELQAQSASENAAVADRNGLRNLQASVYNAEQQGRTAAAKNRMDAFYKEREFQTGREDKAFEKSVAANKDLQSRLEARFRTRDPETGADVVDTQRIAAFSRAVDATLPAFIKMLEQTNTPQSKAMAQKLSSERAAGLDPTSFDQLTRLFDKRELARKSAGIGYGSSSIVESDNLLDYLTRDTEQTFFDPTEVTMNGTRIRQSKLTYGPDGNVVLPNWFETANTNLRDLRARQER